MATEHAGRRAVRRDELWLAAVGVIVLVLGAIVASDGGVPGWEEAVFHLVNDLPGVLYPLLWPFQQLGALVVGPLFALAALLLRKYRLALALILATVGKLVVERLVKALVSRERPGTSIGGDVELRGDVSFAGESFVSGHAILVAALAGVIAPHLPGRWRVVPWVLVAIVMFARVYVGAHNPLDVICGAAIGVVLALVINLVVGAPKR